MWIPPKTDWKEDDFFNIEDYNRIKGNINEIKDKAVPLWGAFFFSDMGEDKTYNDYSFYADEFNRMEENLESASGAILHIEKFQRRIYAENQPFITALELNRIESLCKCLYANIEGRDKGRKRLAFRLNGGVL